MSAFGRLTVHACCSIILFLFPFSGLPSVELTNARACVDARRRLHEHLKRSSIRC